MGVLSRIFKPNTIKATEGQYRDGPWWLPSTGGWLTQNVGQYWNWWQMGFDPIGGNTNAMVEACVSSYAQTIAMCPGNHWRLNERGGRDRVVNSALTRIIRKPNAYQSVSDFLLNITRCLYLDGNSYALALRNARFEIEELHLMHPRQCAAQIAADGSIFYSLTGNEVVDRMVDGQKLIAPARDVLHIKLQAPQHPLRGESPLMAAALQMMAGNVALQQAVNFFTNQSRPSFVLSSDLPITPDQAKQLRERWDEQSKGLNSGGVPILGHGIKPHPISISAQDAQLAEIMKLNDQAIANVFRIPLQILGIGGTPFASTEALMASWLAGSLGFALNHIEEAFGQLFGLKGQPDEYLEFDTKALLRSSFKEKVEALVAGTKGLMAPNEARAELELEGVQFGDLVRVQQQDVPLSFWGQNPPQNPKQPAPAPAPEPPQLPEDGANADRTIRSAFRRAYANAA